MSDLPPAGRSTRLPTVVFSSVIRSTVRNESHGGVYLLDLETEQLEQKIDWDDPNIDFETRGGDRGLRGIAFHGERMFLAAADEVFVYDPGFNLLGSIKNPYLRHCHEINVGGDKLFLGSVGFDSILEYDIPSQRFTAGYCLRYGSIALKLRRRRLRMRPWPSFHVYDPNEEGGPEPGDTTHPSFPWFQDGVLYIAGGKLGHMWAVKDRRRKRYARIPYESHNARPHKGGILMNHSPTHRMCFVDRRGRVLRSWPVPLYDEDALRYANVPRDHAYQGFCRGIAVVDDDIIIQGSSPATINVFRWDPPGLLKTINVTMDVRNSVHGLEIWPFVHSYPVSPAATVSGEAND
jgi:hypothetical protein